MRKILNLTQHKATPEQIAQGVWDVNEGDRERLMTLLTFENLPTRGALEHRAHQLAHFAASVYFRRQPDQSVMIGGAPFFMEPLARKLREQGFKPVFAFSQRESVEVKDGDTVRKTMVFRHQGFVGQ